MVIVFYFRKEMEAVTAGIEDRKTDTGTMKISPAALTALDLLRYPQASVLRISGTLARDAMPRDRS